MAYTLKLPRPYGERFSIQLSNAQDRFSAQRDQPGRFLPFQADFASRHRAFAYIGSEGDEADRLVLVDLTQQSHTLLTPKDWVILDFEPYPEGDRILVSATDRATYGAGELAPRLYSVSTGLTPNSPEELGTAQSFRLWPRRQTAAAAGEYTLVLDSDQYQNLKFDLSADGQTIVVQRVNRNNPADFGPWVVAAGEPPRPLDTDPGGDFLIGPDNQSLLLLQGQGTAVIPLDEASDDQPLDFLPQYGQVFDLTSDGTRAAMVNFNQDDPEQRFTESLFLVTNQGDETELLQVTGSVLAAQFDPTNRLLYCLATQVIPGEQYVEQPFLAAIQLDSGEATDLLTFAPQPDIHMSLSPDGLALLVDLALPATAKSTTVAPERTEAGQIWLLPLFNNRQEQLQAQVVQLAPESLQVSGRLAKWLP
ncbi:uncharacterized protein XM38_022650 [Halomicronema hongdechloris C2206]|uniref:S9 family peptidase n=1 Tax=Halomicronema hongdechloris C2206 TaxID=1641165 RepID=A0A1Z3HLY0_9CYAN|nr:hypothetical protein [Halomicronema hongdechloris]ASC71313.1 uncharacterized protein XM38_022650 [Halomicronema hongdechloris C2206]